MEEALDLERDQCRWQVLCKAPYPNTRDSRVARRLEEGQWGWYYRTTLRTVVQACRRVVRSPDDYGATYLADSSLLDLFERAAADAPDWFAEQVDRTIRPDRPAFDPGAAAAGATGTPSGPPSGAEGSRSGGDGSRSDSGGTAQRSASRRSTASGDGEPTSLDDHPLGDVWGTD